MDENKDIKPTDSEEYSAFLDEEGKSLDTVSEEIPVYQNAADEYHDEENIFSSDNAKSAENVNMQETADQDAEPPVTPVNEVVYTPTGASTYQQVNYPYGSVPNGSVPSGNPQQPYQLPKKGVGLPDEAQWEIRDYGSLSGQPKKPRNNGSSFGLKLFAVIMSVLFVISAASFAGYYIWSMQNDINTINMNSGTDSQDVMPGETKPSMKINQAPQNSGGSAAVSNGALTASEIYEKVAPSVVGVAVYAQQMGQTLAGQGSGIIMSSDGYVITNAHVVTSSDYLISKIEVILPDEDATVYSASLVGADIATDLAVLKIDAQNLVPAEFGISSDLSIGDTVYVIGNPSGLEFAGSFTHGMVSALNRNIYMRDLKSEIEYIQTDAAINSGNSGGAFINEFGQVVGISAAKMRVEAGYEGMGFAIPIDNAKDVVNSLIQNGYVSGRPKIGIRYEGISETIANLNSIPKGIRVITVGEETDAYAKGIRPGDIITHLDKTEVYDEESVRKVMQNKKAGETIQITVYQVDESGVSHTVSLDVLLSEDTSNQSSSSQPEIDIRE